MMEHDAEMYSPVCSVTQCSVLQLAVKKTQIVNVINLKDATKYDGAFSTPQFLRRHNTIMVKQSSKYVLDFLFKSRSFYLLNLRILHTYTSIFFLLWRCDPTWVMASSFLRFLDHTQRRTTFSRTPLDE